MGIFTEVKTKAETSAWARRSAWKKAGIPIQILENASKWTLLQMGISSNGQTTFVRVSVIQCRNITLEICYYTSVIQLSASPERSAILICTILSTMTLIADVCQDKNCSTKSTLNMLIFIWKVLWVKEDVLTPPLWLTIASVHVQKICTFQVPRGNVCNFHRPSTGTTWS